MRSKFIKSRESVRRLLTRLRGGNSISLSDEEENLGGRLIKFFGENGLSEESLASRLGELDSIIDKIGIRTLEGQPRTGIEIKFLTAEGARRQGLRPDAWGAALPNGNKISLLENFFTTPGFEQSGQGVIDLVREDTFGHEMVHSALGIGQDGDRYGTTGALGVLRDGGRPELNVDNHMCAYSPISCEWRQ